MTIDSKAQFYKLWHSGVLGNRPHVWPNVETAVASGHTRFGVRSVGRRDKLGGAFWTVVYSVEHLKCWCAHLDKEGTKYAIDGAVPNETTILQGEICRTVRGLEGLMAVRSKCDMREAQRRQLLKPVCNMTALTLIREFADPSSQDDLWDLLDLYPDATIEFACFPTNVGVLPHRNTIIWEVRNY